jgi:peptidoglycan/LPS O-acetylase OafA/YrhL
VNRPNSFLNWHGFYIISRLSYGIYLNEFGLLPYLGEWLHPFQRAGIAGLLPAFLSAFAPCALFAFTTFLVIERPFLSIRDRWLASRSSTKLARAVAHLEQIGAGRGT